MLCKVIKDNKKNELWAGSATITPATDSATAPVTTLDARQSGGQIGSASGQSIASICRGTNNLLSEQGNIVKSTKTPQKHVI